MTDTPPPVFGDRYQLVRHIARGGMAQVYLARDLMLDRLVALKVLFPELSVDRNFVERFRREARAAANLTHPNIVSVYDWGQGNRTYYIVMEYVDGTTLSSRIRKGPIPATEAAAIASSVAAALAFAHHHSVIHRDVKPGNVLIDRNGQVKVTDFGIARAKGTSEDLTQAGSVMGTATYFSPEQAQGHRVDARSDVYSLGVVLYEMVAGRPPFAGENPVAIAYKHVRDQPEPLSARNPAIPAAYEAITMKALAKDPADRYQSAEELQADLDRFRSGQPVLAGRYDPDATAIAGAMAAPEATRILPGAVAGAAGGMAAAELAGAATRVQRSGGPSLASPDQTGVYQPPPMMPPGRPGPVEPEPRQSHTARRVSIVIVLLALLAVAVFFAGRSLGYFGAARNLVVPDVHNQTLAAARRELAAKGFKDVGWTGVTNGNVKKGLVIDTVPKADSHIKSDDRVTIDVSEGPGTIAVPNVTGDLPVPAQDALTAKGFHYKIVRQTSKTVPYRKVIKTDPKAGSLEAKGTTVTIVLSSGKPKVKIPSVYGLSIAAATQRLANAGFTPAQGPAVANTQVPAGDAVGTSPPVNQTRPYGSTVSIIPSGGPATVTVPYVYGRNESAAERILTNSHLVPVVATTPVSSRNQDGIVQRTNPPADKTVNEGTSVTIFVGVYTAPPTTSPPTTPPKSTTTSTSTSTTTTTTPTSPTTGGGPGGGKGGGGKGGGGGQKLSSTTTTSGG